MIITTTGSVAGHTNASYRGGGGREAVRGSSVIRDVFARVSDTLGGRSGAYQKEIRNARAHALSDMKEEAAEIGADAIVGISLDVEVIGDSMLMVTVSGTAVKLA
jgi:uncharacterized protein YbjQ (UPF0145 family)